MNIESILFLIALIAATNLLGFFIGGSLRKFTNWSKEHDWNVVTFVPKLIFGVLFPIFFGVGMLLKKKKMDKNDLKSGASFINGVESYGFDTEELKDFEDNGEDPFK